MKCPVTWWISWGSRELRCRAWWVSGKRLAKNPPKTDKHTTQMAKFKRVTQFSVLFCVCAPEPAAGERRAENVPAASSRVWKTGWKQQTSAGGQQTQPASHRGQLKKTNITVDQSVYSIYSTLSVMLQRKWSFLTLLNFKLGIRHSISIYIFLCFSLLF